MGQLLYLLCRNRYALALTVYNTSLESLGLVSLKSIKSGSVAAGHNDRMCYVNGIPWDEMFHSSNQSFKEMGNMASDDCGWCTGLRVNLHIQICSVLHLY